MATFLWVKEEGIELGLPDSINHTFDQKGSQRKACISMLKVRKEQQPNCILLATMETHKLNVHEKITLQHKKWEE